MDLVKIGDYIREQRKKTETSNRPLKSIRVIDLGAVVAAPFAATLLGYSPEEIIGFKTPGAI